jgi:hypothetical protein
LNVPPDTAEFFVSSVLPRSRSVELAVPALAKDLPLTVSLVKVTEPNPATG